MLRTYGTRTEIGVALLLAPRWQVCCLPLGGEWELSCGHEVEGLEHERDSDPPSRPRICPVCQTLRNVTSDASGKRRLSSVRTRRWIGTAQGQSSDQPRSHPAKGLRAAGQSCLEPNLSGIVRAMFVLYTLLIVGGIALFVAVGLSQQ